MRITDLKDVDEKTMDLIKQVVQGECDALRTDYSKKIKDLEQYKPKEKTQQELDIEARLKALEDREKAIADKEYNDKFTTTLKNKGVSEQLAKYFVKQGVEDIDTYCNEISSVFNELKLNSNFTGAEHKANKDIITKEQFKEMGYSDRLKLMETNKALYDKLSN